MESIHYTLADPQMIPVDMLDVILPEDIYRLNYSYADHQDSEEEEEEDGEEEEEREGQFEVSNRGGNFPPLTWEKASNMLLVRTF